MKKLIAIMLIITINLYSYHAIEIDKGQITPKYRVPDGMFILFDLEESRQCAKAIKVAQTPIKTTTIVKKENNTATIFAFVVTALVIGAGSGYLVGRTK